MSHAPFFSVIIPTLNEELFLPKLLDNLQKQSEKSFEVIIADGGSTDQTLTNAKKFSKSFPLSVGTHPKKNVAAQRNFGAKQATGQYLIFFDADVEIPSNFLKELKHQIEIQKGYLYTTHMAVNRNSQAQLALIELTNFIIDIFNTLGKPFAPGFDLVLEKSLFQKLNGFDTTLKLAEDHDIVQRARKAGVLLNILKTPVLYPSFRRPERIGYLKFITQYAVSGLYTLTGEPIKKDLYSYPMGGHLYQAPKPKNNLLNQQLASLKKSLSQVAKNIELPF